MKGSFAVTAIWIWSIWCCVMNVSAVTEPSMMILQETTTESNQKLKFEIITLDLDDPTPEKYLEFLVSLRDALKGGRDAHVVCGLPVLRGTVRADERFVLVDLIITHTISVTVAIDVLDIYVVGYLDKHEGRPRANLLKGIPGLAEEHLFPGAAVRHIPFTGHYTELERQGVDRLRIPLGLYSLKGAAKAVYGVDRPRPDIEARFFITAVEMISEAARFKYIAKEIRRIQPYESILPDPKMIRLANKWGPISESIIGSHNCDELKKPVELLDPHNHKWIITKVAQIFPDMGLLAHVSSGVQVS